jgi:hypothetical protein
MGVVEKIFAAGGIDMAASVKAAGDGIANLNAHLARANENMAAVASRLEAIDARQMEILTALNFLVQQATRGNPQ